MIRDYMIHRFLREQGGRATKKEILEALGSGEESKRLIEDKLAMMARFNIIMIDGEIVSLRQLRELRRC